jgi:molybdenum-dependent DNA-binding transcriptional regulator ModE
MKISRAVMAMAIIAMLATLGVATRADAQGRGMGRRRGGESDSSSHAKAEDAAEDMANRYEDMAATKPVLKDVKVEKSVKDSVQRIEKSYRYAFRSYGRAMQKLIDDARTGSGTPDGSAITQLRDDARKLQDREYAELRELIAPDQRPKFDENIVKLRAESDRSDPQHPER